MSVPVVEEPNFGERIVNDFLSQLERITTSYRQTLDKAYQEDWRDIANEYNFSAATLILPVTAVSSNIEKITHIAAFTSGAMGQLTIGDRQFIIPGGVLQTFDVGWYLHSSDKRSLAGGAVAGGIFTPATSACYLELFGVEIPYGRMTF